MSSENSNCNQYFPSKYRDVYMRGKPKHDKDDIFSIKHPAMDLGKRAKIFSPFDALKGFDDELEKSEKDIENTYTDNGYVPIEEFP
ncbi:MAG: hypothetical protein K6A23_09855 [Butyrivibrio sp.]|nr:hypothetical protein [Butyrivibrio sp.]